MDLPTLDRFKVGKQKGGIKSAWNDAVDKVYETIKDQKDLRTGKPWTYPRWCKELKGIPPSEICSMLASAKSRKNVGASFNYFIKQYKKRV